MSKQTIMLSFLFLAFIWGASFIFTRVGVAEMGAPVFGGLRVGIAALALLPVFLRAKHLQEFKENWLRLSLIGIISSALPFMLFSFALYELNAGTASVINASVPMMTGFIAHLFFNDKLTKTQLLGLIIGLAGVSLLMYDGITSGTRTSAKAFLMAIGACLCYAMGSNFAKNFLQGISPMTTASSGLLASALVTLPIVIYFFPSHHVSATAWGSVFAIAVFSTAAAMVLFYRLIQEIGPTKTTVVTLLIPIFGVMLGILLLGETLTSTMLVGAVIVLCGTSLTLFAKQ